MKDERYTQGIEANGAAILFDGHKVSIDEVVKRLNACEPKWIREARVGKFLIIENTDKYVWIDFDGEGGQFLISDLEKVIDKFYQENF